MIDEKLMAGSGFGKKCRQDSGFGKKSWRDAGFRILVDWRGGGVTLVPTISDKGEGRGGE